MITEPFSIQKSLFRGKILSFVHVTSVNIIVQNIRIYFTTQTAVDSLDKRHSRLLVKSKNAERLKKRLDCKLSLICESIGASHIVFDCKWRQFGIANAVSTMHIDRRSSISMRLSDRRISVVVELSRSDRVAR